MPTETESPSSPPKRREITKHSLIQELEQLHLTPDPSSTSAYLTSLQSPWLYTPDLSLLSRLAPPSSRAVIRFTRTGLEGRITGYKEVTVSTARASAKTSTSFSRRAADRASFVRGQTGFMPFAPGGLEDIAKTAEAEEQELTREREARERGRVERLNELIDVGVGEGLLSVPPGFKRGLGKEALERKGREEKEVEELVNEDSVDQLVQEIESVKAASSQNGHPKAGHIVEAEDDDVDLFLPVEFPSLAPNKTLATRKDLRPGKEWAHSIDVNRPFHNFRELVPTMARNWPFELDTFQKEAVYHLELGDSVFVAAHTSAGKTVVAEYAIALAAKHMTKTIYTSPIKALSNQKFRDFRNEFQDVGILTGDVQINPEASCLIMTTEILRSMLYRGADLIRDVEYVIFDEVHYVNDLERGVVWEEVIIMLPDHVTMILLSATVPNTFEFASWVGRTKKKDVYVISTPKRPVPLEHYLWASKRMFKIMDADKKFLEAGWKDANSALSGRDKLKTVPAPDANRNVAQRGGRGGPQRGRGAPAQQRGGGTFSRPGHAGVRNTAAQDKTLWVQLVSHLRNADLLPTCIFVFSRRRCDDNATALNNQDYTTATEKSGIHLIIEQSIVRLKPEDRTLPQILRTRELLSRGLAVHHAGLLPIVKELVEILFAKGLVKVLFATETFAMGLNLPTRTVVFASTRKHDGTSFRDLLPGEYTQMAGRAGRRGLDKTGTVIIVATGEEAPPAGQLRTMLQGQPTKLRSQFRLTYNMILSLLRVEALRIEEMIKRSFSENATQALLPRHEKDIRSGEADLERIKREKCDICDIDLEACYRAAEEFERTTKELLAGMVNTPVGRKVLSPRRLVAYRRDGVRAVGMLLRDGVSTAFAPSVQVLELGATGLIPSPSDLLPLLPAFYQFIPTLTSSLSRDLRPFTIPIPDLERITTTTLKTAPDALLFTKLSAKDRADFDTSEIDALLTSWPSSPAWVEFDAPRLLRALPLHDLLLRRSSAAAAAQSVTALACPHFLRHYAQQHDEAQIQNNIAALRKLLSDQNLMLLPDYGKRLAVLRELEFIVGGGAGEDDADMPTLPRDVSREGEGGAAVKESAIHVTLKGRVACEIRSADPLVLTELLLDNALAEYDTPELCALLSSFVFHERSDVEPEMPSPKLEAGIGKILEISERVNDVQLRHQVFASHDSNAFSNQSSNSRLESDSLVSRPRFGLVGVVHAWASGRGFKEVVEMTDVPEGSIVRVMGRLDECLREVRDAARVVGDMGGLGVKMVECQEAVRRDIMGVASLYM